MIGPVRPLKNKLGWNVPVVCIVGLGYVGLPLAEIIRLNAPDVVKFTRGKLKELRGKEVIRMAIRELLIEKIRSLPENRLEEIANFVEFLETKEKGQSELAEYGMGDYLNQLSAYEEMLAAGKINLWHN